MIQMPEIRRSKKPTVLKVVILGDGGVGKSCLLTRFVANRYDENNFRTIGVEFMKRNISVDDEPFTLQIWDTAGQERFQSLRTPFYRGSDVCLLCYAVNDRRSFDMLKHWRKEFLTYADVKADFFPFIVVGTKVDTALQNRQIQSQDITDWCDEMGISTHIETSSKAAKNVTEAFTLAVRQWRRSELEAEERARNEEDLINLRISRLAPSSCCGGGNKKTDTQDDGMCAEYNRANPLSNRRWGVAKERL